MIEALLVGIILMNIGLFSYSTIINGELNAEITTLRADVKKLKRGLYTANIEASKAFRHAQSCSDYIKSVTTIDADISPHAGCHNTIITIGTYNNRAHVQCWGLGRDTEFKVVIDMLRDMKRHGSMRHIDAPHNLKSIIRWETQNDER